MGCKSETVRNHLQIEEKTSTSEFHFRPLGVPERVEESRLGVESKA
jgi:hypothetical protein